MSRTADSKEEDRDPASEIEDRLRKDASGLSPFEIQAIIALVLKLGPKMYNVVLRLFRRSKKG